MLNHPLSPSDITVDNASAVARDLLSLQAVASSAYIATRIATGQWGDDDTDYLPAACEILTLLQSLAVEPDRDQLVGFLFSPQNPDQSINRLDGFRGYLDCPCSELAAYMALLPD